MYYPPMAYRMVSLEPPLTPPIGLGGIMDTITSILSGGAGAITAGAGAAAAALPAGGNPGWCSTSNPQGTCKPIRGVCLPMNATTLEAFKNLQRQANRMAAKEGRSLIAVDGRIGPNTITAVADALRYAGGDPWNPNDLPHTTIRQQACDQVAASATTLTARIKRLADGTNTPTVADPSSSVPSQAGPSGTVVHPSADVIQESAAGGGLFGYLPQVVRTPLGIGALIVGGLLIRKAMKSPGRRAGGRRRPAARRRR